MLDCKETATSRETFIRLMNERGYGVDRSDSLRRWMKKLPTCSSSWQKR
ncbi:hypothetical protein QPA11_002129 [Campylobacter coli]|nr:hypothetical protein [Campylobacter coli]ELS5443610.1 hypothetical protein [Campylobacter coli]ELS5443622.1 hypothetical protein [Campylobacter coli]ELS5443629.1 hypothetical protein [Campylobacter coli]ELS5443633.1 hypothetical protein [Campylobacter coli]